MGEKIAAVVVIAAALIIIGWWEYRQTEKDRNNKFK